MVSRLAVLRNIPYALFSDADFGALYDPRLRSTTGWCCYVYGCLVSWHSRHQTITAKSTSEAQFTAAATCSDEGCWLHQVAETKPYVFNLPRNSMPPPIPLLLDNNAALLIANKPRSTTASKHIDIRYFPIRDAQGEDSYITRILCYWIPTAYNPADRFFKRVKTVAFRRLTRFIVNNRYDPVEDAAATYTHRKFNDPAITTKHLPI